MTRLLQVANIFAFLLMVAINYLSNTGLLNNTTIGEVSAGMQTLFTPAGYAFAIWGLIYLMLLGFVIYQAGGLFGSSHRENVAERTGWWFVLSCLANSLWVICWIYGFTLLSVVCIFLLLFFLFKIVYAHHMELWDAPITVIAFLWWPFVIYSGWVTVASVANTAAWLYKIDWDGFGMPDVFWTVLMILVALLINLWITWSRNMREFALVGAWALVAIAMANQGEQAVVYYTALASAIVLVISSGWHGWKNRATNPIVKLQQYIRD